MKNAKKVILSKMKQIKEHERIIPELRKVGLKREEKEQKKDLSELRSGSKDFVDYKDLIKARDAKGNVLHLSIKGKPFKRSSRWGKLK